MGRREKHGGVTLLPIAMVYATLKFTRPKHSYDEVRASAGEGGVTVRRALPTWIA